MILVIEKLEVRYGPETVLHPAGFELSAGTVTALVGPNGAGKSTLLRAIAGLVPYRGRIRYDRRSLERMSAIERSRIVAYMPQNHGADTVLTVLETVLLGLHHQLGWRLDPGSVEAAFAVLERLDVAHLADRPFSTLSGGQRQLVMFAQLLLRSPSVLLLDEPTSALDLHHQIEILEHLRASVRDSGGIALVAIHDLSLATRYADHLLLLDGGRLRAHGPPLRVLTPRRLAEVYRVEVAILRGTGGVVGFVPLHRCSDGQGAHPTISR